MKKRQTYLQDRGVKQEINYSVILDFIRDEIKDEKHDMEYLGYTKSQRLDALEMAECALVDVVNYDSEGPSSNNIDLMAKEMGYVKK